MLDRIKAGEADAILAWHPDRLSRNPVDGSNVIYMLDTGELKDLKFCTFWFENTPQGKFMLAIEFGMSKHYVDKLSMDIRRGQRQRLKEGIWPQWSPLGYLNDHKNHCIVPDPERGPLIRPCFEFYATGTCTLDQLTEKINALGMTSRNDTPLSRTQYHRLLRNPIYYGLIRYNGEFYEGSHQPLITKDLFDRVQRIVEERRHPKKKGVQPYLYRKMFRCGECGGFITMEVQKGHHYLRCTKKLGPCSQPFIREESVTAQVQAALNQVAVPIDWIEFVTERLEREEQKQETSNSGQRDRLCGGIAQAEAKVQRATDAYLGEALPLAEYRTLRNQLTAERHDLRQEPCREPLTRLYMGQMLKKLKR